MNNLERGLKKHFGRLTHSLLTVCMVLGLGLAGAQAQADLSGQFYFKVVDEMMNETTVEPGESFTLIVGFTSADVVDGVTITLDWDASLAFIDQAQVTQINPLNATLENIIENDNGHMTWSSAYFPFLPGSKYLPDTDDDGNPVVTNHDLISFAVAIPEGIEFNSVVEFVHQGPNSGYVNYSALVNGGASLISDEEYENIPPFIVDIDAGQTNVPANDECSGALPIGCGETVTGNTEEATPDAAGCSAFGSGGNGVWYTFTAPYDAIVTLQSCLEGTTFDTDLNVYTGPCDDLTCFTGYSGDGYTDGTEGDLPACLGDFPMNWRAGGSFNATAGETYTILLSGYDEDEFGAFELQLDCEEITCSSPELALTAVADPNNGTIDGCIDGDADFYVHAVLSGGSGNDSYSVVANGGDAVEVIAGGDYTFGPFTPGTSVTVVATGISSDICSVTASTNSPEVCPPDNDDCFDALPLVCGADSVVINSAGSTAIGPDGCTPGNSGLWYSFTGTGGDITISSYADFDHELTIKSGSCDELIQVGCKDGALSNQEETYTIEGSVVGTAYYVYVARYSLGSTVTGTVTMKITCAEPPACEAPLLDLAAVDADGFPFQGCLLADDMYYVNATLSGGSGNDSYNVSADGGDAVNVAANGSTTFGPFAVGSDILVEAVGADDAECSVEGSVDSPEVCPPDNETCEDAIALECGADLVTVSTTGSTAIAPGGCSMDDNGVWFSFVGTGGDITITSPSSFDTELSINMGTCDDLTNLACRDFAVGGPEVYVVENSVEGATYYVYVAGWLAGGTTSGLVSMSIECAPIPLCEAPSLDLAVVDATGAPIDGCLSDGGMYYVNATLSGGSGNDSYDVSADGGEAVNVAADGSYLFGPFDVGTDILVEAVGADDALCGAEASAVSPDLCPPANDNCADAAPIACGESMDGSTYGATESGIANPSCGTGTLADVFYTLEAMPGTEYTITVNGDDYDGVLAIYSGSCDGDLVEIDCADNGFSPGIEESITFMVDEATTVLIRTYDWSSTRGSFTISVSCETIIVWDCPQFEANIGEECMLNGMVGQLDGDCNCIVTPEWECPELEANYGDDCMNADGMAGILDEDCMCIVTPPSACENFVYFLSDHSAADGIADIYMVTLNGGNADLDYIATSEIEVHIAYNQIDNLIYAVSKHTNSYRVLDPYAAVPTFGPTVDLGADYGELTAAAFNADGKLLIGSQNNNAIYSVNVATNVVSPYDTYAPVTGGDIAYGSDGMLYLATRTGNGLYQVWTPPTADQFIGSAPSNVTGLAITDADKLLMSSKGSTNLMLSNSDGSPAGSYAVMLNGEAYTLRDGDMASGCDTHTNVEDGCEFSLYFADNGNNSTAGTDIYGVTLNDNNTTTNTLLTTINFRCQAIAVSPEGLLYLVSRDNAGTYIVWDVASNAQVGGTINLQTGGGANIGSIPAAVYNNGMLYVGSTDGNIYAADPLTGISNVSLPGNVVGGDVVFDDNGDLWLLSRDLGRFYNISGGGSFDVATTEINGVALLPNGNFIVANGDGGSLFHEVDPVAGALTGVTYDTGLPLNAGDLAGVCVPNNPVFEGCYGVEVLDFNQGAQTNGGAVAGDRSDENDALGEPDRSNAPGGFFSLGVGGYITIGFAGVVNDAPGNDIKIWETSYTGDACSGASDERADIELSADGINFVSVGSICRDGEVDMADAGLTHVSAIRITNSASTGSLDGYDVDGVEAIYGCTSTPLLVVEEGGLIAVDASHSVITSYPNPTAGQSEVVFTAAETGTTLVEVYDMNGRNVATLFNQVANANQEYRLDFDGNYLPNGVYIYRLTTNNETIINKFMIAK